MKITLSLVTEKAFFGICVISTLSLISYCVYQYLLNEDTSVISFRRYNANEDNIYPAVSLCFGDFIKPNLFESSSEEKRYKDFLSGRIWDDQLAEIRYEDSVKDILDYLLEVSGTTYNVEENKYSNFEYRTRNATNTWKPKFYRSLVMNSYSAYAMCWTFEVEYRYMQAVNGMKFYFESSIFKESLRKSHGNFYLIIAYPGQMSAFTAYISMWKPINYSSFTMEFNIQNVVVLNERKKYVQPCNSDWKKNDEIVLQKTIETVGCKPIFFPLDNSLPICKNASMFLSTLNDLRTKILPCKKIEKVLYSTNEYKNNMVGQRFGVNEAFEISFIFQGTTFTEIDQARKIDFQSLVGNAGGYVGLFLGAAISQVPGAISTLMAYLKE